MRANPFVKPSVVDERVNDPVSQIGVDLMYGTTMNDLSNGGGACRFPNGLWASIVLNVRPCCLSC